MTGKRPRRWLRWTAAVLLLGVAALAFAGWLFVRDRERVAALVVALGAEPGHVVCSPLRCVR
mgnify:CR=1 FL=1